MKKFKVLFTLFVAMAVLSACSNDGDDYDGYYVGMGTLQKESMQYSISFDNGHDYELADSAMLVYKNIRTPGQRVIASFNYVGSGRQNTRIALTDIYSVLTKDFIARPETADEYNKLGNDAIRLQDAWIAGGFLNISFSVMMSNYTSQPHLINVVRTDELDANGYRILELRHNLNGNLPHFWSGTAYASFIIPDADKQVKGYALSYQYGEHETRIIKVDNTDENTKVLKTTDTERVAACR